MQPARVQTLGISFLTLSIALFAVPAAHGATATFTPLSETTVQAGTDVVFQVTVSVVTLAEFDTADIIIGSNDATDIAFAYAVEWTAAFANVTPPVFDTGLYAQDVFVGGNNPTPVGTSMALGTVTVNTTGMNDGTYNVVVDNGVDGVSTLGLAGQPEALNGTGAFTIIVCITDADCDDGIGCTVDACNKATNVCENTPNDTVCDDGLFCTGVEYCDPNVGCLSPGNPCPIPADCDENTESCGCKVGSVAAEGPRYLGVTLLPGNPPVALRVTGVDPEVSCVSGYVQADGELGATPVYKTPAEWAITNDDPEGDPTVHVRGENLMSSMTYEVRIDCDSANPGTILSDPASATLWLFGDASGNGDVGIIDVLLCLNGFRGSYHSAVNACIEDADCPQPWTGCDEAVGWCAFTRQNVDLYGAPAAQIPCTPNIAVEIMDVLVALNAFRGTLDVCPVSCPP